MAKSKINKLILLMIMLIASVVFLESKLNVNNITLYINWKIFLPKPTSETTIFKYEYREGEDLRIWNYENNDNVPLFSKKLDKINNINLVKTLIEKYYSYLNESEQELFKKNIDYDTILSTDNYYLYKTENNERGMLILIFSEKEKKLYIFNVNH